MAIIAEKISFSYNRKKVLEDFSISLNRNDFTMLLGSNGSGKSTAVKLLGNFLKPDSGKITVDGINADKLLPFERAKKIAVISQTMPPVLNFTVREMVLMGRFCHVGRLKRPTAEDLQIAESLLSNYTPESKYLPNLACVYGLMARVYMWDEQYANAANTASYAKVYEIYSNLYDTVKPFCAKLAQL